MKLHETFGIITGIGAKRIMQKKIDYVRAAIARNASVHTIARHVTIRCIVDLENWVEAATAQLVEILDLPELSAQALVSEHTTLPVMNRKRRPNSGK